MTLFARLWVYQSERFPLQKTAPLLAVFSASSICVSAEMAGRDIPNFGAFCAAFIVVMAVFFQMRVCDEVKDLEDDIQYRPSRPIPRGLVSLRLIVLLGIGSVPLAILAGLIWHPAVLWLLLVVWIWLAAMTLEFGVPDWLKARPVLYLISHMAIMPLIDLLLTAFEWLPAGSAAPSLWLFIILSFINGCVLEIGRKLWAPENEIEGVDSYSKIWGHKRAVIAWALCVAVSYVFLIAVGVATSNVFLSTVIGGVVAMICLIAAYRYFQNPSSLTEKRMDDLAGVWVFTCYATAGFGPFIQRLIS